VGNQKKIICFVLLGMIFFAIDSYALRGLRVQSIHFKGTKVLSSLEIIKRTKIQENKGWLTVDLDSLEKALSRAGIIEKYTLNKKNNSLIITVAEKSIKARVVLYIKDKQLVFDIDENNKGIEKNRVYSKRGPSFIVSSNEKDDFIGNIILLKKYIDEIGKQWPLLYNEIEAIRFFHRNRIYVVLYNRKTSFIARLKMDDFLRIGHVASFLDRKGHYPSVVDVRSGRIVIGNK
jgi:hypothetical protein